MFDSATNSALAFVGGGVLFLALFGPIVVFQYRRYGAVSPARILGAAAISVYGTAIVTYTLLPLPIDPTAVCAPTLQTRPFAFVEDIARRTRGLPSTEVLTSRVVLQVVLNVVLFVPWGIIVRRYLGRGVVVATVTGFAASLLIESTQYTGVWGYFGCPYRVADVDDLLTNTTGALLGALIAPVVLWWMPHASALAASRLEPRPVTVWRRWIGMAIDLALLALLGVVASVVLILLPTLITGDATIVPVGIRPLIETILPAVLVFVLPALSGSGASLGQRAVWLEPRWSGRRGSTGARLGRALAVGGTYALVTAIGAWGVEIATPLAGVLLLVAAVLIPVTRTRRGLSGVLSRAEMADARSRPIAVTVDTPGMGTLGG